MPKIIILTSGLSCTGKTTWRNALVAELTKNSISVITANADELTIRYCQEKNRNESTQLSYSDMFSPLHQAGCVQATQKQFAEIIQQSNDDVIILDRTHLSSAFRQELIQQFDEENVVVVYFNIADEAAWRARLSERNINAAMQPDPAQRVIIRDDVIAKQKERLQVPSISEGMSKLVQICCCSDASWDDQLKTVVSELVEHIQLNLDNQQQVRRMK